MATPISETEAEAHILHAQVTASQLQAEVESESLGKTPIIMVASFVNDFITEFVAESGLEEPEVEAEAEWSVATDAGDTFDFKWIHVPTNASHRPTTQVPSRSILYGFNQKKPPFHSPAETSSPPPIARKSQKRQQSYSIH
ncbi:hypothetical protein M422DRAFT_264597 [Sphaerobolus stellatus SS14]|uniref:Uncharacterized protein n=1 Tax=Sphaerobolus stellatus (strain SS14) TaxID=990650 RepID=A0A0C9V877_SPHS4|nr:hypothetical protein M422DRAFT_264597 [Sphaerobolus stellatus SS14]